jgi:hypothetical protein
MEAPRNNIHHAELRELVDSGAKIGAEVVGTDEGWSIVIRRGRSERPLTASRGELRVFRKFETLAGYLKTLGLTDLHVQTTGYQPGGRPPDSRSVTASRRMRAAHDAAAYDQWFRAQVQAALDDKRPSISDEDLRKEFAKRREAMLLKSKSRR